MTAKLPSTPVKRAVFKPKSLLGLSISLLMWQPQAWADATAAALPQLNEETTPKVGFDTQVDGNTLTVNQSADKVILNWQSFNIGENNAVHFQQVANGIALNRILDQAPSQILGSLTATGSIYLLNPNGVLFGQHSQVHVGNLLVSTQEVDTERFLKSNINTAIEDGKAALNAPGQEQGSIDIEKGAHISTESGGSVLVFAPSITNAGSIRTPDGQTVLAASQDKVYLTSSDNDPDLRGVFVEVGTGGDVTNLGEIVAERGNVTLMGLAVNQDGRVRATSSVDVNGTIRLLARDGAAPAVSASSLDQSKLLALGVDSIAEAPNVNSSLVLSKHTGDVTLGANSLTQVSLEQPPQAVLVDEGSLNAAALNQLKGLAGSKNVDIKDSAGQAFKGLAVTPEAYTQWRQTQSDSPRRVRVLSAEGYIDQLAVDRIQGASAVDASVQNPSKVELYGQHIELGEQSRVEAKGGSIKVVATDGSEPMNSVATKPSEASVHLAKGAQLDVSGADVTLTMERNSLEVEVRGNEVRDQPLQRDGVLRAKKVNVDARLGTKMVDIQGSLEKQAKSVAERSTKGGAVQVLSEGYTDFDATSQVNIQGGKVNYSGGELVTTGLIKDGKVIDISDADPNQVYEGIKTLSRQEAGYTDVQDAGSLEIQARNLQLDATLLAGQAPGQRQLSLKDQPNQGTLTINLNHFNTTPGQSVWLSPLRPDGLDLERETWLNPQLINAAGLSQLDLFLRGDITQEQGGDIHLANGGKFTAYGQEIVLAGTIDAAGGKIDISSKVAVGETQFSNSTETQKDLANHAVHLIAGANLDVSGNWVNRSAAVDQAQQSVSVLDGGSISLRSRGDLILDAGATIAANAGALLTANNSVSGGKGGAIGLQAAYPAEAANITLDAKLQAQGFSQNGSLSVELPELQIGRGEPVQKLKAATVLDYDFFAPGGFAKYSFTTNLGGADLLPQQGESFAWQQRNWVLKEGSFAAATSNRSVAPLSSTTLLPDYLRKPVSFSITQKRPKNIIGQEQDPEGYIHFTDGVDWQFDPLANVNFSSVNRMYIGGTLSAPGGELSFNSNRQSENLFKYDPSATLWLGKNAWLSVAGVFISTPGEPNLTLGKLIDGGRIRFGLPNLDEDYSKGAKPTGRLVTEEGSGIDLSAASETFDSLGSDGYHREARAGNAGNMEFYIADGMLWQSTVLAKSYRELGGKGASVGVSMLPESDLRSYKNEEGFPNTPRGIDIFAERQQDLLEGLSFGADLPAYLSKIDGEVVPTFNRAYLFAADTKNWNLDNLTLNTVESVTKLTGAPDKSLGADVSFHDSFSLKTNSAINLDTNDLRLSDESQVDVASPWLVLGEHTVASTDTSILKPNVGEANQKPNGFLTFRANEIELAGKLLISGAADTALVSQGSLLAHGAFDSTLKRESAASLTSNGNLSLISSVLYPGSLSNVTIESTAPDGIVEIASNSQTAPKVLTAGGSLSVKASQIEISGALSAPFGKISLEGKDVHLAPGAWVNVSGDNQLIPFGSIIGNDLDWLYSLNPQNSSAAKNLITNTPAKQVNIKADRIEMDEGSRINLSGGGDLLAYQFAPGPTGSRDVLATSSLSEGFALLPAGNFAAYDSALQGQDAIPTGSRITLSTNPLLPAGDYYLLPSRYALLPGAYWVKPTGTLQTPGSSQVQPDGGVTLTGKLGLAHTEIRDADWRGFTFYKSQYDGKSVEALAPNGMANYKLRLSDSFFSKREDSALLPHAADAGSLVLDAQKALRLSSGITGQVATGEMGARVDILGEEIHLVDKATSTATGLNLLAEDLSNLNVGSTLIGGSRDDAKPGEITVSARKVTVEEGAKVSMPAVVLVAKDEVRVKTGVTLTATAADSNPAPKTTLSLNQPAALVRLAGSQAELNVPAGADSSKLTLDAGATLKGNALIASAGETQLNSTLALNTGGALSLVGGNIQLGGTNPNALAVPVANNTKTDASAKTDTSAKPDADAKPAVTAKAESVAKAEGTSWLYFADGFFSALGLKELSLQARQQMRLADGFTLSVGNLNLAAQTIERTATSNSATPVATSLKADTLSLSGSLSAPTSSAQNPSGAAASALNIQARHVYLGTDAEEAGQEQGKPHYLAINGFKQVNLVGQEGIDGLGKTNLSLNGNLDLTGNLATLNQGTLSIQTTGQLATHAGATVPAASANLGGSLSLWAAQMNLAGSINTASGQVQLTSEGNLHIQAGAVLDVAGISRHFGDRTLATPGGSLSLTSLKGDIEQDANAQLLFGAQAGKDTGGGAGSLALSAAQGSLKLLGDINGSAPGTDGGGQVRMDAKDLGDLGNLSALLAKTFNPSNSQSQLDLRQRQGDLTLAADASLSAGGINLTADTGALDVQGKLLTEAGQVGLWAYGNLSLGASSQVRAQSLALSSQTGAITAASGSQLTLGSSTKPGELNLTASEKGLVNSHILANTQGITLNAELWLRQEVADGSVSLEQLQAMNSQAEAFLAVNPGLFTALTPGQTTQGGLGLHAELYSSGDIHLASALDLSNWRLGKTPVQVTPQEPIPGEELGVAGEALVESAATSENGESTFSNATPANSGRAGRLTLRAAGNLYLDKDASLSDGFTADTSSWGSQFLTADGLPLDALMSEDSSHISLISGADLTSSNVLNTQARQGDAGSLHIADGVTLRTGTGDINLAAQGNLEMADTGTATIYTAGKTQMRTYAGSEEALPDYGTVHPYTVNELALGSLYINKVYYPEAGGDIHIRTGGDIQGSKSHQLVNEWLHRAAGTFVQAQDPVNNPSDETTAVTRNITTWGIGFQDFSQGIASLGGGNLSIQSGGSINDLAVSSANTGKAVGEGLNNQVQQSLSGAVTVQAIGDINSGRWYGANNRFDVTSLGQMGNTSGELAAVIGLGDASVKLTATADMAVEAVFNPTQMNMSYRQFGSNPESAAAVAGSGTVYQSVENYFSTYGLNSNVGFISLAGDLALLMGGGLKAQPLLLEPLSYKLGESDSKGVKSIVAGLNLLPGKLDVASVQGDINLNGSVILAPELNGRFNLTAQGNIVADSGKVVGNKGTAINLYQLDLSSEEFGTISQPLTDFFGEGASRFRDLWTTGIAVNSQDAHNSNSVFRGDTVNNWIYSSNGDIGRSPDMTARFTVVSAKGLDINSKGNLADTSVIFHHQDASQHSSITTGGDLVFRERRNTDNKLSEDKGSGLTVLGAGSLRIQVGNDISLGTSDGIQSLGQGEVDVGSLTQFNPYLPDKAADLYISAGVNKTPNYSGLINQYLAKPIPQGKTFVELITEASPERLISELNLILAQPVKTQEEARSELNKLPLWQQQQVALGATRFTNSAAAPNYSRELVAYVTNPSFDQQALQAALNTELGLKLAGNQEVQNALAALPIGQQHSIALKALGDGSSVLARNFLDGLVLSEIRQGGEAAIRQGLKRGDPEGYERGYAALATLYPGIAKDNNPWAGSLAMDNTKIRTTAEADVNILLPGGNFEVGLETPTLDAANRSVGLVLGSFGDINVAAAGSVNVNKSRIFNLGGGDVMLWSSYGDVDAGKGAKTALSVPPPKVQIDPNTGASRLVFPPAVAGSGIQATNPAPSNDPRAAISDGADVLLFAPAGIVDAGDAGISSTGNILVGALEFVGRDNVAGNVTISVASDSSVAMPAGSANAGNDAAQSAEKAADNASGEQKEEKRLAYLTIELLGTGKDDDEEDEEEKKRKKQAN